MWIPCEKAERLLIFGSTLQEVHGNLLDDLVKEWGVEDKWTKEARLEAVKEWHSLPGESNLATTSSCGPGWKLILVLRQAGPTPRRDWRDCTRSLSCKFYHLASNVHSPGHAEMTRLQIDTHKRGSRRHDQDVPSSQFDGRYAHHVSLAAHCLILVFEG